MPCSRLRGIADENWILFQLAFFNADGNDIFQVTAGRFIPGIGADFIPVSCLSITVEFQNLILFCCNQRRHRQLRRAYRDICAL